MELHVALRNILRYQGRDFLLDPKVINALGDYQAFEQNPALKNIFRILHMDNFIAKIAQHRTWDPSCNQLVYEVERDYAFPHALIDYVFKSVAYGLGALQNISVPAKTGHINLTKAAKPWKKMSDQEKAAIIDSKIEVKQDTFNRFGLTLVSHNTYFDHWNLLVATEVSGECNDDQLIGALVFSTYDENGKLSSSDESAWIYAESYCGFQT